jgi:hypothetical protein
MRVVRFLKSRIRMACQKLTYLSVRFFKFDLLELDSFEKEMLSVLNDYYGHRKSRLMRCPSDAKGLPTPWFTYPAITYFDQFNLSGSRILEWGSGASTLYWNKQGAIIHSIEHDPDWHSNFKVQIEKTHNITYELRTGTDYYELDLGDTLFDVIVVDGIFREECVRKSLGNIKEDGIIILDNSERHSDICAFLRSQKFNQIDFHGLGPINCYTWTTTFFFKNLNLVPKTVQPVIPPGGIQ